MFIKIFVKSGKKGQALVLAYMVIAVFIVFAAGLLMKALSEKNIAERNRLTAETFYLAEGATESAIQAFTSDIANFAVENDVQIYNASTTFTQFANTVVNTVITRLENNDRQVSLGSINAFDRNYEAVSTATHPQNSEFTITVHQIFTRRLIPTFQHAVFYEDDLEILPGPAMTLSGRIHSNHDIYIDSNNTLTVDSDYLRCAGDIYNKRKDDGSSPAGDVSVYVAGSSPDQYQAMSGLDSDDPTWTTAAISRWNGTVQSSVHGVTELTAPAVGSIAPGGYYNNEADVVIINDEIYKDGSLLQEDVHYPAGTISSSSTDFYNNRESKYVKMTNVDLDKLAGKTGTCGGGACANNLPNNGLLYATRNDAGSDQPGIRLINPSKEIDSPAQANGITVVSNDPVYIKGDYNTTNKKPASVISDSLNILSNQWQDSNSTLSVSSRVANETTINCAFIAGIDTTTTGNYNGGLENYPRMHEKWSGKNLNIRGSFVALWNSAIATGAWVYGNPQYEAPGRNWDYDTDFNNSANLPPYTPMAVGAVRIAWWVD